MSLTKSPEHARSKFLTGATSELRPRQLLPNLTIGVVVGLVEIVLAVSFAAIIFSGDLSSFIIYGLGLALIGAALSGAVVALMSTLPGTVGGNQDSPAVVMAVIAAGIAASLAAAGSSDQVLLATVLVSIALVSLLTGAVLFILGTFELGSLVRFLPYPVIGGFLAGTGWLLLTGSIEMLTDLSLSFNNLGSLFESDLLARWLPGLLFAAILLFLTSRYDNTFILPGMIIGGVALFYLIVWVSGTAIADIRSQGWLFGPFPSGSLWMSMPWAELDQVDWRAIALQLPNIGSLVLLSAVGLLLNSSGLEVSVGKDVALNRELRAAGIGNIFSGLVGGLVGYQQISLSTLRIRLGEGGRLVGLIAALMCLLALFVGAAFLSLFPKVIAGGVLLFLGLAFLKEWVYDAWFCLPRIEYAIVIFILAVVAAVGFLAGVGVGVVAAIVMFAFAYSQIDVVRNELTGQHVSSRVSRSPRERNFLWEEGDRLYILTLQGFIFFGTSDRLLTRVREKVEGAGGSQIQILLFDFRRVTGLDSTALRSLRRLREIALQRGLKLLVTGATPAIEEQLQRGGLDPSDVLYFHHLDQGVTWCENQLLQQEGTDNLETPSSLVQQLADLLHDTVDFQPLLSFLVRQELAAGDTLIKQGDPPGSLYFIESGQVTARLDQVGQPALRLQTMGSGHIVGEIGFYLKQRRTASVVADEDSVVYCLTRERLARMEEEHPETASLLHRLVIQLVSERVSHLTRTVDALER
jgi:SulP family sulfate permease